MKIISLAFFLIAGICSAQSIQPFTLTNVIDGKPISLKSFSNNPGVVVVFTSNECAFDHYYMDRLRHLADTFRSRIPVLLINSHTDPDESPDAMRSYAQKCNLNMPYLSDKDQVVLSQFNARKSPEAFLLKNAGGKLTVVYRGAIDDNPQSEAEVLNPFLRNAITKLLAGETPDVGEIRPAGCSIRKN